MSAIPTYYVDDGTTIAPVYSNDLPTSKIQEWQVRLYRRGEPTGGRDNWGLITGSTSDKVMEELRSSQAFEKRYARWIGKPEEYEINTHFNYLGPIAIVKPQPWPA